MSVGRYARSYDVDFGRRLRDRRSAVRACEPMAATEYPHEVWIGEDEPTAIEESPRSTGSLWGAWAAISLVLLAVACGGRAETAHEVVECTVEDPCVYECYSEADCEDCWYRIEYQRGPLERCEMADDVEQERFVTPGGRVY